MLASPGYVTLGHWSDAPIGRRLEEALPALLQPVAALLPQDGPANEPLHLRELAGAGLNGAAPTWWNVDLIPIPDGPTGWSGC